MYVIEKFEDTKYIIRRRKSIRRPKSNDQKKKDKKFSTKQHTEN